MVLSLFLTGCASVSSTAVFYQPTTANFFPPKPSNAIIPILDTAPSRPFTEIGKFAFQTTLGYPFAINSVLYNARRSGADAVVVKNCRNWTVPYSYVVPPSVGYVPAGGWGGWYGGRCWGWGGGWYGGGVAPVVYPGYAGYSYQNFTGIDARMIVFKH
jgi:hypothetical protein